ncbi:SMI1/KNR4 family protein [Amycolatopsis minnesotensis]|uniref:SMI1/KNR4 family protein n=1 Tax=Amycolatopsis minnesotensis TaxID=337894 RepID=UPI0031CEB1E5
MSALFPDAISQRALAMLFDAAGSRPSWTDGLPPLDLDAEERAHLAHLRRAEPSVPAGLLGESTGAKIVSGLADHLDSGRVDPVRAAAFEVESGAPVGVWAEIAVNRAKPDVATLAAGRRTARVLAGGADPLGLGSDRAGRCAGDLVAALRHRFGSAPSGWGELVDRVLDGAARPEPVDPATLAAAEERLGVLLPDDYRAFLRTCDGLPAGAVFPRLLSASELVVAENGAVVASERGGVLVILTPVSSGWRAVEWDPELGSTAYSGFRDLMENHLRLVESSR